MLIDKKNTYLAKWLNNDLTHEELKELKKLPEYKDYKKILEGLKFFNPPSFEAEYLLKTTIKKLDQPKKGKLIKLKPIVYAISIAATILFVIVLFFKEVTYSTTNGQQLVIVLPDGSSVDLNAASRLSHQRFFWLNNREVKLEGEAFFNVSTGTTFKVITNSGEIDVLGTLFNVKTRKNEFEVGCYEGKVRVSILENEKKILKKGDVISLRGTKLISRKINQTAPLWKQGESLFDSVPLANVLDELERQYGISFKRSTIDQNQLFTGGFNYKNLDIALESVLAPMGIDYLTYGKTIKLSPK